MPVLRAARTRRLAAVLTVACSMLLLAACSRWYGGHTSPGIGTSNRETPVKVANAAVVVNGSGHGTVVATFVNQAKKADEITDIGLDTQATHVPVKLFGKVDLPVRQKVRLATTGAVLVNAYHVKPGQVVQLSIDFENNQSLKFHVPVEKNTGPYADVKIPTR